MAIGLILRFKLKNTQKMIERIKAELKIDIPNDVILIRTYAGFHQKSAGAVSSYLFSPSLNKPILGFYSPLVKLLKCPNLSKIYLPNLAIECNCGRSCKGYTSNGH